MFYSSVKRQKAGGLAQLAAKDILPLCPGKTAQVLTLLHTAWYGMLIQAREEALGFRYFLGSSPLHPRKLLSPSCAMRVPAILCSAPEGWREDLDHLCAPPLLYSIFPLSTRDRFLGGDLESIPTHSDFCQEQAIGEVLTEPGLAL